MTHAWTFSRIGGFEQVRLVSGADLAALEQLDQKLWVALACPVKSLELDARSLDLMDTDRDSRIRVGELLGAIAWLKGLVLNLEDLPRGLDSLALSAINQSTEEGRNLVATAKTLLVSLGKPDATSVSVADMVTAQKAFEQQLFNGDGVVPPESITDEVTRLAAVDLLATIGGEQDVSGKPGFTAAKLTQFFTDLEAFVAWSAKAPLKPEVAAAAPAFIAVKAKVDDFFARTALASFDARSAAPANRSEAELTALFAKDLSPSASEATHFPLAHISAGTRALPLLEGVNPAWASALQTFATQTVKPLLGGERQSLTEPEWQQLTEIFAPHQAWQAAKAGGSVEKLGLERVKALLANDAKAKLEALLAEDKKQSTVASNITAVEKLVRLHRDLFTIANNFVTFREFYARKAKASFQAGRLFLDRREIELCIKVEDAAKHATMAPLSRMYLAYCDCVRPTSGEKMSIAAAVTAGDVDDIMVGRNGVFYDRQGRDWDATVTKIVDNPISIKQAFWSPYKKLVRFVEEQLAKRAAAAESVSHEKLLGTAGALDKSLDTGKAEEPKKAFDVGVVAALGVAVGGITAAFGALLESFFGLGFWMPLGVVGLLLAISGPSMAVAYLKLRQRSLGPLLDANGWAINAPARINVPFGGSLTKLASLPPGASRELADPFAEKPRPWGFWLVVAVLLAIVGAWYAGKLDGVLPGPAKSTSVLGALAPSAAAPAPAAPAAK